MTPRTFAALLPLLLAAAGCVEQRGLLVTPGGESLSQTSLRLPMLGPRIPPHEAIARRVAAVGLKLVDANPQAGLGFPLFVTVGLPQPEILHSGGGTRGYQVAVSQGLAEACKTDEQLAAALALELGKIVVERASGPRRTPDEPEPPPEVNIGNDVGGTFGPPDGTRQMELARLDAQRRKRVDPPAPEVLARKYLQKAGYAPAALGEVALLLHKADGNHDMESALPAAPPAPPAPAAPARLGAPQPTEAPAQSQVSARAGGK